MPKIVNKCQNQFLVILKKHGIQLQNKELKEFPIRDSITGYFLLQTLAILSGL